MSRDIRNIYIPLRTYVRLYMPKVLNIIREQLEAGDPPLIGVCEECAEPTVEVSGGEMHGSITTALREGRLECTCEEDASIELVYDGAAVDGNEGPSVVFGPVEGRDDVEYTVPLDEADDAVIDSEEPHGKRVAQHLHEKYEDIRALRDCDDGFKVRHEGEIEGAVTNDAAKHGYRLLWANGVEAEFIARGN